jgi:hypothetical protein
MQERAHESGSCVQIVCAILGVHPSRWFQLRSNGVICRPSLVKSKNLIFKHLGVMFCEKFTIIRHRTEWNAVCFDDQIIGLTL